LDEAKFNTDTKLYKAVDDTNKKVSGMEKVHESIRKQNPNDAATEDQLKFVKYNKVDPTEPTKPTEEPEPSENSVFQQEIDYSKTLTTETIREGTRLAYFATQYYGHPDFWIYIYEANKDIIKDPSNVLIGTQIKIPKLPAELIDATNEDAINFAISLAEKRN
jgi:nucleoid-associated protein YgaU